METLVLKSIKLNKKVTNILDPLEFEMEMKCSEEIPEGVVFTVVYNVNVKTDKDDQILSEIEIAPIPKGNVKFSLDTDAPDLSKIPHDQLFGLTSIIIIGKYKDQQFIRIGYIVDIYYPGIPNDKLAYNELEDDVDYEEIAEEEEEEEEEEGDDEDIDDLVVSDSEGEQEEPRTLTEAIEEKIHTVEKSKDENAVAEEEEEEVTEESASHIREELDKPVGAPYEEKEDDNEVFEYKGFKLSRSKIEMNIMEPPSVHTFLINWLPENEEGEVEDMVEGEEDVEEDVEEGSKDEEECEENVKKVKLE